MKSALEEQLLFQIDAYGITKPKREHRFHPTRKWRFDFAWEKYKVAVEVEGGVWVRGRHNRASGFIKDMTKYNEAAILGWVVIRVSSEHIDNGMAIDWISRALESRGYGK